jgi:serine/threonine protein kinase
MGSVFIAQDRRLGRVVALKVLRREYDRDADLLRRFALEAQVGAQLEHPNIACWSRCSRAPTRWTYTCLTTPLRSSVSTPRRAAT